MNCTFYYTFLSLFFLISCNTTHSKKNKNESDFSSKVIIAYVTSWSDIMPDPTYITHINYAFGHVNDSFNGVRIDNEERLKQIVSLKKNSDQLKVLLSIGGWGSGRFSEMAADETNRLSFSKDCKRVVEEFDLDGIDIDWEYPGSSLADISSSPDDTENFTLLMRDIRSAIGENKLLTLASAASAEFIDFRAIDPYVDFVNIMAYDMASAPHHHSALYRSENAGRNTSDESVKKHMAAGVPASKLVLGMPFYGRGGKGGIPNFIDYNEIDKLTGYKTQWDETAKVPYLTDDEGNFVCGYENPLSLAIKCKYITDEGLLGGMYWDYDGDNENGDLRKAVYGGLTIPVQSSGNKDSIHALVLTERGGQHGGFTGAGLEWLKLLKNSLPFDFTEVNNTKEINDEYLSRFNLIIQLDYPPYSWTEEAEAAFTKYIDNGSGGWIGFHHATLLGEFDGYPMWKWFSEFMGGIQFQNYIAPLADGTVMVEYKNHPVMKGIAESFVIPEDEWYTFDSNPRRNVHVLASVDESSYKPVSDIRMGDHPVIWINENKKARNVYFLMGHSSRLFATNEFTSMFRNAIIWAAGTK